MNLNTLKPNKENLYTCLTLGISLLCISFIDIFTNTFLNFNITEFFPSLISYFSPLILGGFGLYFMPPKSYGNVFIEMP